MEVHNSNTKNPWTYLEIKKLKVKVIRPINTRTVNAHYLPNGKAYELQTWYTDGAQRPASASLQPAMRWQSTLELTGP